MCLHVCSSSSRLLLLLPAFPWFTLLLHRIHFSCPCNLTSNKQLLVKDTAQHLSSVCVLVSIDFTGLCVCECVYFTLPLSCVFHLQVATKWPHQLWLSTGHRFHLTKVDVSSCVQVNCTTMCSLSPSLSVSLVVFSLTVRSINFTFARRRRSISSQRTGSTLFSAPFLLILRICMGQPLLLQDTFVLSCVKSINLTQQFKCFSLSLLFYPEYNSSRVSCFRWMLPMHLLHVCPPIDNLLPANQVCEWRE